ncbi:hypothetical protein BGW38_000675 [Lunasporangiospora selenospora]|uniref:Uncharacterized protein n=1 Tax=Lunasporangiospora selenospora TaxID=979761 RepID=A0A9P6FUH9_9FUNG|nr:hypothetical protein BGW38_000675 [Lunasporangiospora selenospora]
MASFGSPLAREGTVRRRAEIILSTREKQVYGQLWAAADTDNSGFITGADAVPFFSKSGLSQQIWMLADAEGKGVLGQQGFSIALKLIAHAQNGKTPSSALISTDAPLPQFDGLTAAKTGDSPPNPSTTTTATATAATTLDPPLTTEDKTKYGGTFVAYGPVNGLLPGDKARELFLKSGLPVEKLSQIWALADTKQRGTLDIADFTIAMYYLYHSLDGSIANLPTTLPANVLKACSTPLPGLGSMPSPVMSAQTLTRQATGNNMSIHNPVISRQLTGSLGLSSSPLAKQNTGGNANSTSLFGVSPSADIPWEITPEEKAKFDKFFDQLDRSGTGSLGGEDARRFFMNSRLPETVLAQIWDLSDITGSGTLSKDEFAVAMLLINRKNASNTPIPTTLPLSLIPPSLRTRTAASTTFGIPEPVRSMTLPTAPSSHARHLSFDLLGDGPMTSVVGPASSSIDKDLIGDDLTNKITSETGELASMQNQINSLSKVTGDLQAKRTVLEKNLSTLSVQKQDISIRLNQIKTLHENEVKSVKDLENALSTIQPQLIKLREELVVSERELAVARANKDEFVLNLTKEQEESNMIRTRLRQNNDEIVRLKEELEAKKKDTGRQKGLLEIARRQLATSDADKQKVINDIEQEAAQTTQIAYQMQTLSTSPSATPSPSGPPPVPEPRGTRKEPPPPPASRGSKVSTPVPFASRISPEAEEAFGIPPALRSPTGSFQSATSPRMNASVPPQVISRQSTGTSPFDSIPRQTTGSSPFDSIPRQTTGSSPFDTIPRQSTGSSPFDPIPLQGTGASAKAASITSTGDNTSVANAFLAASAPSAATQESIWSPSTHAAQSTISGMTEVTKSPDPETPAQPSMDAFSETAASQALPVSAPTSLDPFSTMAFPVMDTPPVTKMDFDSAFSGFGANSSAKPSVPSASSGDGVKSAEAFAAAFPDIDQVTDSFGDSGDGSKSKRVSAFGFEDDFGSSPFGQPATESKKLPVSREDDEFPPIVEVHTVEDSSDDSDNDNEDAFVQAHSSVASPDPSAGHGAAVMPSNIMPFPPKVEGTSPAPSATSAGEAPTVTEAPIAPVSSSSTGTKKLTAADFGEFESSFGGSMTEDFESAFKGVELAAPKLSSGAGAIKGFDDTGFDFNASFDDPFGSSFPKTSGTASVTAPATTGPSGNAPTSGDMNNAFGVNFSSPFGQDDFSFADAGNTATSKPIDLDEAFGAFGGNSTSSAGQQKNNVVPTSGFGDFGDFENDFGASSGPGSTNVSAVPPKPASASAAEPASTSAPEVPTSGPSATTLPDPPQVELPGVNELMNMGFSRQRANDALSRYDTVERAANFLLEGGH